MNQRRTLIVSKSVRASTKARTNDDEDDHERTTKEGGRLASFKNETMAVRHKQKAAAG